MSHPRSRFTIVIPPHLFRSVSAELPGSSKEEQRVLVSDQRGAGVMTFRKVTIHYADGSPYYDGWIQVFGEDDCRNGPTSITISTRKWFIARTCIGGCRRSPEKT